YRFMGKQINLDPGFLVKVLQGKIHISKKTIPEIIKLCKLNGKEAEYFEKLVLFCKTKRLFKILLDVRGMVAEAVEPEQYEFYKRWYYTAVRAIIGLDGFQGDYKNLAQRLSPKISVKEAKESIVLLEKLGFIQKDEKNEYAISRKSITVSSLSKRYCEKIGLIYFFRRDIFLDNGL
ncbi:MAG: TIGR02147 family protein, partial [bacterium]|nr:TIGR02147 family protein [bacterium]